MTDEQDGDALRYVVEQTDELCAVACRQWLSALHHIADDDMRERVIERLIEEGVLSTHPLTKPPTSLHTPADLPRKSI